MTWHDDRPQVATKRSTFVAAEPAAKPVLYEVLPPAELPTMAPASMVESRITGSHEDRARGFQIVTVPIAIAFGVGVGVVAVLGFRVPVLSLSLVGVFWCAFLAWWVIAWALHLLFSADGISLLHTWRGWRYLEREQAARLRRYERGDR